MYCPQCLAEYRDGFTECADCRAPLAAGRPPKPAESHGFQLVTVLETHDSFALSLAKSTLEDAGIDYMVGGEDPLRFACIPGTERISETPLCNCNCWIQVPLEDESEARVLLEPLTHPDPLAADAEEPS